MMICIYANRNNNLVLRRGLVSDADKTDRELLKKVAEYIKYSDKNPLDVGEETVVRFMKADGVTTKVVSKDIENLVVLIKGNEAEGGTHLLKHYEQFKMAFGIDSKEELKDLISYTCSKENICR